MYVRSGKTDPGVAVSFGFGVGCWPRARPGATSPLTTNAAMLTAMYRTAAPWVGRANVAVTSVRRANGTKAGGSKLEAGRAELDAVPVQGHFRFCRCQYHHMHHASRAQTSQGARNITGWASRPHAAGHVTRIIGRQEDEGRAICGSRSGN